MARSHPADMDALTRAEYYGRTGAANEIIGWLNQAGETEAAEKVEEYLQNHIKVEDDR